MSLRFLPTRGPARRDVRDPGAARDLAEGDLDAAWGHFGPTRWCDDERVWREQLANDRPARVFLLADDGRGPRLVATFD
ncbi:hypothetical protein [Deinococcus pimensis]|uniref:hypothetical protein n=1 Tax=Deinococcus pimensis TaxID=309888 RepID=UPI000483A309|nr:hypothetical protein [Deinococcus pimensis]